MVYCIVCIVLGWPIPCRTEGSWLEAEGDKRCPSNIIELLVRNVDGHTAGHGVSVLVHLEKTGTGLRERLFSSARQRRPPTWLTQGPELY